MSEQRNPNIRGEPLPLDELLELMGIDDNTIDIEDIESAIIWWDDNASPAWVGALDAPFYEGDE